MALLWCVRLSIPALAMLTLLGSVTRAFGEDPELVLKWRVNDIEPLYIYVTGELNPNGSYHFGGELVDPEGNWELSWNFNADLNPFEQLLISGPITVQNLSTESTDFTLTATFPVCPPSPNENLMGGIAVIGMTSNPGGGSVTCPKGDSIWTLRVDGEPVQQMFYGPYDMTAGGASNFAVSSNFGIPIPSAPAPPVLGALAIRYRFQLTDGDVCAINSSVTITDDPSLPGQAIDPECPTDLNGDGVTGADDLALLFGEWGASGGCLVADVDGDGEITGGDLVALLSVWGVCS